jgi:pimeloyl-ACP methyl ester carboxylesterase
MATIDVNGTTLYYEDTGAGSTGETIAFSHGLLWGTELFAPQIEALRGRYRCIAWDHRGQGRSAPDHRNAIGMELVTQDAAHLLEALRTGPVHFLGLSMGGFVAMRLAARRPARTIADPDRTSSDPSRSRTSRVRLLTRVVKLLGPRIVRSRVGPIMLGKTILTDPKRCGEVARFTELMSRRKDIWRAVNGVIDRAGIHDELARISVPTLVLVGDEDVATPVAKAERIVRAIPGASLTHIPRAGHSSTVEEPGVVTAAIESFANRGTSARSG